MTDSIHRCQSRPVNHINWLTLILVSLTFDILKDERGLSDDVLNQSLFLARVTNLGFEHASERTPSKLSENHKIV